MDEILNQLVGLDLTSTEGKIMLGLILGSMVCGLVGRAIPDDKKGALGVVRKVAKVGGLVLSNRISSGVSVNDVAKGNVIPDAVCETIHDVAGKKAGNVAEVIVPALVQAAVKEINPISGNRRSKN